VETLEEVSFMTYSVCGNPDRGSLIIQYILCVWKLWQSSFMIHSVYGNPGIGLFKTYVFCIVETLAEVRSLFILCVETLAEVLS
jgi:hypothetical protein